MSNKDDHEQPIKDRASLDHAIHQVRKAQQAYSTFTQEQVDTIFFEAAMAANKARIPLAKMAVEETGMGIVEDKVIKNHYAAEYIYNAYKDTKTVGVIEQDIAGGYKVIAEPIGIIAAVIPTTNPTSTTIFKCLIALKTRNAIIISPHPRALRSTIEAARIIRDAVEAAGAPLGLIRWIDKPSLELTNALMQSCDTTLATGGPGMVKAAYSSGKPALGVGAGNVPAVIDSSADIKLAVMSILHSKTFDNGVICASEQAVIALADIYEAVRDEFKRRGAYILSSAELKKVRTTIMKDGTLNADIVGQSAARIAELSGFSVPANTKVLIGEVSRYDASEPFAHERLSPVLALYKAKTFDEATHMAEVLVEEGGFGHTSSLFIDPSKTAEREHFENAMKTGRVLLNQPSSFGGIGDIYNFRLTPSLTLGCGSWGGNATSENVGIKHLLNTKVVAERATNMLWYKTPDKIYFKRGCTPVALEELKAMGKQRAFVVTDQFLYKSGFTKAIEEKLDELGIVHACFWNVAPDPSLQCAKEGLAQLASFNPDCIIAVGGGSAMDAAKIMWIMFEHPECKFEDMAMDFMDIRKRIYTFPEMGSKAYFVAVPTSSGTGSEVTPFAIITDETTGIKWPIADYQLMPNMAIVDVDNMMSQPPSLTAASGLDTLTHALEALVSVMASDFTKPSALQAIKLTFDYLRRAYDKGADDPEAREHMANASCIAGIAFANAFLGLNHSMAHKLGAFHHIPHGVANAIILTRIMRYNATEAPPKMGTFPQYGYPEARERYVEAARYVGIPGNDDDEVLNNFIGAIDDLIEAVGVKRTIKDYGIAEHNSEGTGFLDTLDEMVEQAFNDQCTPANPRYPLMDEIRELYLDAYYGREPKTYE